MTSQISHTPPGRKSFDERQVRRRQVFYLPGYDPEARSRYRLLFVRELTRYAKQFGEPKREIGRAGCSGDGLVQSWTVAAQPATGGAKTYYDVLLWDDIVGKDAARSKFVSVSLLTLGTVHALVAGKLYAFYRLNWKYGNIILYPFVMLLMLAAATAAIALTVQGYLGNGGPRSLGWPLWFSIPLGVLAGLACVKAAEALLNRAYFWQLLNDWVFNWQHGQGWRGDYAQRLDLFAERAFALLAEHGGDPEHPLDEILIVGHSTGGLTAVELAARLLARDPELGLQGPSLSLATLGSGLPLVAVQPKAERVRADIALIAASQRITWVDYVAPQDWMNFPRFNPLFDLDLKLPAGTLAANPVIRSSRFRDIIDPETYFKVRFRPFRMHFQFLMSNDRRGNYDYFAMTLGPQTLGARAAAPEPDETAPSEPRPHQPIAA